MDKNDWFLKMKRLRIKLQNMKIMLGERPLENLYPENIHLLR